MLLRSCFSVTMASPFEIVDEEYIEELKERSENENTKNSKDYWKNRFQKADGRKKVQANLDDYESYFLDLTLSQFYAFRNSVISFSMLLASNRNRSS